MKISVVIPVYNEVDSIPRLYKELSDVLSNFDWYEIFFIDDGSSDGSDKVTVSYTHLTLPTILLV